MSRYPKSAQPEPRRSDDLVVVGTVAHLSREKGLDYLIEAASMIPEARKKLRFVIVGDGDCLQELKDFACEKGVNDIIEFPGFRSDVSRYMKSFDIFVLPSLSEGLPSAILEAMATALPIVATAVGGVPELVNHGDNGLMVAPADPASLAHAIQHLADHPDLSRRMGLRGRDRMEEQFNLERKILETEQLCSILLRSPTHSSRSAYA